MLSKFKNKIIALFVGSFSIVLAACYGVPVELYSVSVKTVTVDNEPITGLKVSLIESETELLHGITDSLGSVSLDYEIESTQYYSIKVEDIDGAENGEYQTKEIEDFNADNVFIIKN